MVWRAGAELAAIYVSTDTDRTGGRPNALYFITSRDGGRAWSTPREIDAAGHDQIFDPRMRQDDAGRLHVVWRSASGHLTHAASSDRGATWARSPSARIPGVPNNLHIIVDRCGALHAMLESHGNHEVHLVYMRFANERWSMPVSLAGTDMSLFPSFGYAAAQDVIAAWSTLVPAGTARDTSKAGLRTSTLLP
jgi:hypothetical protein